MNKRIILLLSITLIICLLAGCAAHIHKVGQGAQGAQKTEARQWYVLWGLVLINEVDTQKMAEGAADYTIKTEQSALDVIINIFTTYVSVVSRTVTVTK
jgi:type III secretory pathway lipoprotein EscJ